ncbi:MFS transporter [Haliscomenobacter hydrossis]|uniref:Major facilitator superfamily MFS_1 n=1 Tax=Haliscomenobacter hydrossis (strain ATCC 27775 / DSM 1100 / LMG 10767 / O) TaxID=760192 RepID=F4L5G1_HALH1|nr:MFS transporter [Haliscomenobacter hydrossis]AEE50825.1 major facilitator superfamily MFS_1 [Haliscomenobacter hydrossis DSM 1100]
MKEEILDSDQLEIKLIKNQPRILQGWAFFDWANSAYALVITVAIFPGYFLHVTADEVVILGMRISDGALYSYSLSFAYLLIALVSPLLSGIADYGGRKKVFLRFFTTLGALACMGLLFFTSMATLWVGVTCFILATIGFSGGLVFYNAFLPEIATEDRYDKVSAMGFSYGFAGSIILLVTNLIVIQNFSWFGFSESLKAVPVAFVMVGLWWLGFSQIPLRRLPEDARHPYSKDMLKRGYEEVSKTAKRVLARPNMLRYLSAFFFANAGVQSVLYLASIFAEKELHFDTSSLIILILILQIVGIGGAFFFAWVSSKKGNKFALITMMIMWTLICVGGYIVKTGLDFYFLAAGVGLVMGGMQSLARATYAKLLPENTPDTASYFSFYDILDKLSTVMGTFLFGLITQLSGGMRNSVLFLAVFFIISLIIMRRVQVTRDVA